jgi:hypothetical protein
MGWSYTPTAPDSGTIVINYSFNDDSGTPKSASFNIPYAATDDNNVVGAAAPTAVSMLAGATPQQVLVTFNTDDPFAASNLTVTSDLLTLPPGWSAPASFSCATVAAATGAGCQLTLSYAPSVAGSGTLSLTFGYSDNAGNPKTGSVQINYAAT